MQPCSLVTHGCGTPCCKALSQRSKGVEDGLGDRLPALAPGPRAGAAGRGRLSVRILFPALQRSSAGQGCGTLVLDGAFEESQPCGKMGRAVQPTGSPRAPSLSAGRGEPAAANAPRDPGRLCLPVTADSGLHAGAWQR